MIQAELKFESGKFYFFDLKKKARIYVPDSFTTLKQGHANKTAKFSFNEKGEIKKIEVQGTTHKPGEKVIQSVSPQKSNSALDYPEGTARAPYNFIPLVNTDKGYLKKIDTGKNELLSGYVDFQLKAITPLFIRGANDEFISIDKTPIIPGSTFRGLVANLANIVTGGPINQIEASREIYRRSTLLRDKDDNVRAGIVAKENGQYVIYPAQFSQIKPGFNQDFEYMLSGNEWHFSTGSVARMRITWKVYNRKQNPEYTLSEKVLERYIKDEQRGEDVPNLLDALRFGVIGSNRCNLQKSGVPIFFRLMNNEVEQIGHCKYFRVKYKKLLGDAIPEALRTDKDSFYSSIFGTTKNATRLYFEDCKLLGEPQFELSSPKHPKILAAPKPTTYAHYLRQPSLKTSPNNQISWDNDNLESRGHKQFWHKETNSTPNDPKSWIEESSVTPGKSHPKPINPIKINSIFSGRIRFIDLLPEELGLLLFVLDLPKNKAFKLGMGKPLGLGSVQLDNLKVVVHDLNGRYKSLFDSGSFNCPSKGGPQLEELKNNFARFFNGHFQVSSDSWSELWTKDHRLKELAIMLDVLHNTSFENWNDSTRYMQIEYHPGNQSPYYQHGDRTGDGNRFNEYKRKPILPKPSDIIKPNKKQK